MEAVRFALLGLGVGAAYVLVAQGLVLIYRGSGLLNFAQGAVAMMAAQVFYRLQEVAGLPMWPAAIAAVLFAAAIGAAFQYVVIARLHHASALVRLIATLGLFSLLTGLASHWWGNDFPIVESLLPTNTLTFGDSLTIGVDRILLIGIAFALTAVLTAAYHRTRFGYATTAVAENQLSAMSQGWSPTLVATGNWAIGCALAGLAGVLLAPIAGIDPSSLSLLVIPGLAAAIVGGFSSFWLTLAGGLTLGIIEAEMARYVHTPGWSAAVPFMIIVAVLVIRGRPLPIRGELIERRVRVGRPSRIRWRWIAVWCALLTLVTLQLSPQWQDALTTTGLIGLTCLSLVVLTGYAGQLSLAQYTIFGVAALIAARLSQGAGLSFFPALIVGTLCTVLVGLIIAVPAVRTRGMNLAVVTLGFALVLEKLVLADPKLAGAYGIAVRPARLFGIDVDAATHPHRYTLVIFAVFVLCALMVINLRRTRAGRCLLAVRNNERAASALGINIFTAKLYAFGVASAIVGVGGALAAHRFTRVDFSPYTLLGSINVVVQSVFGGVGYIGGAVIAGQNAEGGFNSRALSRLNTDVARYFTVLAGAFLLIVLVRNPNGLFDVMADFWKRKTARFRRTTGQSQNPLERPESMGTDRGVMPMTLDVRDVGVSFGAVQALQGVNLSVRPGQVLGLIGPNGAGKTTFIDAVTGVVPSVGLVNLNGQRVDRWSPHRRAAAGLGRSFQSLELFEDMTVLDNLRTAADRRGTLSYVRDLFWPQVAPLPPVAIEAINDLDLAPHLDRLPEELPSGTRRLVSIARALAAGPSVLMLDEPAAGLSDGEADELGRLIRHLADEWKLAILLIEHHVDLVMRVSDRVVALDFGQVIAAGTPAEVATNERLVTAYLGDRETTRQERRTSGIAVSGLAVRHELTGSHGNEPPA
jgi:ABC-type branched-subunit amino acid transport system ATPase component/branched-subunit amino acid ABC-type transport system permease component